MRQEFKQSIEDARKLVLQVKDLEHDIIYVNSVLNFALKIAKEFPKVDSDLIRVAVWWHDVGRLYGEDHEEKSAKMAYESLKNKT